MSTNYIYALILLLLVPMAVPAQVGLGHSFDGTAPLVTGSHLTYNSSSGHYEFSVTGGPGYCRIQPNDIGAPLSLYFNAYPYIKIHFYPTGPIFDLFPWEGGILTIDAWPVGCNTLVLECTAANEGPIGISTNSILPVGLVYLLAAPRGSIVELSWQTATETNNYGFDIEQKSNADWAKVGFVEGHGTTNAPQSYSYADNSASGKVSYRLKQIDRDGKFEYSKEVEATIATSPTVFALSQNYPNPFNPTTNISFTVPATGRAKLKIFNILGLEVATLFDGEAQTGIFYQVQFNGAGVASGMYFSRLEYNGKAQMTKMTLLK